jgi:hypothetical protein
MRGRAAAITSRLFLRPLAVVFQFQALRLDLHAGDGGVGAEGLEGGCVEFPRKGAADFTDGGDAVFEEETEFHARIAALLVKRVAEQTQESQ